MDTEATPNHKVKKLDYAMDAALDLRGQISNELILIARVWGFQNGVKRPDRTTDTEATTWSNFLICRSLKNFTLKYDIDEEIEGGIENN